MIALAVSLRVVDELSVRLAGATETAIDEIVRLRGDAIKAAVETRSAASPRCLAARPRASGSYSGAAACRRSPSAVSSLPGAFPGVGTATEIGAGLADTVALVYAQVAMIMAVAAAFDHDLRRTTRARPTSEWCWRSTPASRVSASAVHELASGKVLDPNDRALSEHLSRGVGALVVQRTARRRVRTLVGREIPFGVGVLISSSANFTVMHHTGRTALRYYEFTAKSANGA